MKQLQERGWVLDRVKGSHHTFVKAGGSVCHYGTSP